MRGEFNKIVQRNKLNGGQGRKEGKSTKKAPATSKGTGVFKTVRLYKRETEGSRKIGENKGKRAKNIPSTLKVTGDLITE